MIFCGSLKDEASLHEKDFIIIKLKGFNYRTYTYILLYKQERRKTRIVEEMLVLHEVCY